MNRLGAGLVTLLAVTALACNLPGNLFPTATPAPTATPDDPTAEYRRWPVILRDDFAAPANSWDSAENSDDRWAKGTVLVQNGEYAFDLTAKTGFVWWSRGASGTAVTDFFAAVDARQVSGAADADYGLIFHYQTGNYYMFSVNAGGQVGAFRYYREQWETLLAWTESPVTLQVGQANRLAVAGAGNTYRLFIDNHLAGAFSDDVLPQGEAGLAVELYKAGDTGRFAFDNFEFRAPAAAVVTTPTPAP